MDTRVIICLLFSGVCFTSAALNKYVYVEVAKTWYEAQDYCRALGGHLASVTNMEELNQVTEMTAGTTAYIGLNDFNRFSIDLYPNSWRWSTGTKSRTGYMNFASGEPNYGSGKEECLNMYQTEGTWGDGTCSTLQPFVCFSGPLSTKTYHLINQALSWESARSYCRTNFTDLAMIETEEENQKVSSSINSHVWIGLYRVPWKFSDGTESSFRHWWSYEPNNYGNAQVCGTVHQGGFSDVGCTSTYPFLCQSRTQNRIMIMIQSTIDLTDQNINNLILLQLSESLVRILKTGINLTWRAPPHKLDPPVLNDDNK